MRKYHWVGLIALAFGLLACIAPPCAALYYKYEDAVQTRFGQAIQGAEVYVYKANTRTEASVYSDIAGATEVTQPIETDEDGEFMFYVGAGIYDLVWSHSAWALSDSMLNLRFGVADSATTMSVDDLDVDSLRVTYNAVVEDTVKTLVACGTKDANWSSYLFDGSTLPMDYMHSYYWMGRRWVGMNDPTENSSIEKWHHGRRKPAVMAQGTRYGKLRLGGYNFHFGTLSIQMPEMMALSREHASYYDSAGTWTGQWDDRSILYFSPIDTTQANSYTSMTLANDRGDSSRWLPKGVVGDPDNGWAAPEFGIRLQTDLPDSGSTTDLKRDAVQIRWWMSSGDHPDSTSRRHIRNYRSAFLRCLEHNNPQYALERDALQMWAHEFTYYDTTIADVWREKKIQLNSDDTGGANRYTSIQHYPAQHADGEEPSYLLVKVAGSKVLFRGSEVGAPYDVELEYNLADIDSLYDSGGADIAGGLDVTGPVTTAGNVTFGDATTDVTTVTGEFGGAIVCLPFTRDETNIVLPDSTKDYLSGAGGIPAQYAMFPLHTSGSLVGLAFRMNVDSYDPGATMTLVVNKNASAFDTLTVTPDTTGYITATESIARGDKTFAAGDGFGIAEYTVSDTMQIDRPHMTLFLQLDD